MIHASGRQIGQKVWSRVGGGALGHAEAQLLMKAYYFNNGKLPKKLNMYVDRPPCNGCTGGSSGGGALAELARALGVERLTIYYQGGQAPVVL